MPDAFARYERRSMLITANQPFGEWNRIFPDDAKLNAQGRLHTGLSTNSV
jgi:DNA replication protein DnaC